jgi:hypothetical protein
LRAHKETIMADAITSSGRSTGVTPTGVNYANDQGLPVGMNPATGFAARYNPSQLGNVWDSPWAILPDVFRGMNMAGPGYQALRDIGADPLTLYNIMVGGGTDFLSGGGNAAGNYANWLNNLYSSMGQTGGRGFNAGELISRLFNPRNNPSVDGGVSSLYNILTAGDAGTQSRTLFNMLRDSANVGMNPLAARGYTAAATRGLDQVLNAIMNDPSTGGGANNTPVYQLFKQYAPGLVPG